MYQIISPQSLNGTHLLIFTWTKSPGLNDVECFTFHVTRCMIICFICSVYPERKSVPCSLIKTVWVDQISFLLFAREIFLSNSFSLFRLACFTLYGIVSGKFLSAQVPGLGEQIPIQIMSNLPWRTSFRVSLKSFSVSPGKPTIISVVILIFLGKV